MPYKLDNKLPALRIGVRKMSSSWMRTELVVRIF